MSQPTAADIMLRHRYGSVIPATQTDSIDLWASTIPTPFDEVEDSYGAEWTYDVYGAEDAGSVMEEGVGIAEDLTEAFETAHGRTLAYRPGLALTAKNAAEISEITGQSLQKAKKALEAVDEIASAVGMVLGSPWSWIILGSIVGTALSIELAKAIKKRKSAKGAMIRFAEDNNVPEASNFIGFAVRASKLDPDSRLLMANRLSKRLDRSRTSQRARDSISAKLKVLAAFQLVDAAEEEDAEAQASLSPSRRSGRATV